jgi:predicted CXXCH cytochrome family protein
MLAPSGQPGPNSLLCLSCHDGTVAVDSFGGNDGSYKILPDDDEYIGINLSNDHPVGIDWVHKDANNLSCAKCHLSHGGTGELPFFNSKVECASCHDVHNKSNMDKLLRISNTGSALCLFCHPK